MTISDDDLLSRPEAARLLGMSTSYLEGQARRGEGPTFFRLSSRRTAYRRGDILQWLKSIAVQPRGQD